MEKIIEDYLQKTTMLDEVENGMLLLQPQSPNDAAASMQQLEIQATELLTPVLRMTQQAGL
jgi:hypothetical protein